MTPSKKLLIAGCMAAAGIGISTTTIANPVVSVPGTSVISPQPLGTTVTITGSAVDADPGTISYRFEVGAPGSTALSLVRDFSVDNTLEYTPTEMGGTFQFTVIARNNSTLKLGSNKLTGYKFTALVQGGTPAIKALPNPLVALFASPPCASGGTLMRAAILRQGSTAPTYTNWKPCKPAQNINFIIAGMRAATPYSIRSQTYNGSTITPGAAVAFTTGTPSVTFPVFTIPVPQTSQDSLAERFMLMSLVAPTVPMAIDLSTAPVWYYQDPSGVTPTLTRPLAGGHILLLANGANSQGTAVNVGQILREIDLAGNIIRETNATRIQEQVTALSGIASSCQLGSSDCLIGALHHEATRLPNGHTLVLADEEKIFTDGTQGSSVATPVDIMGDIMIDLDTNWKVVGYWRAFDHLPVNRAAILGETCVNNQGGCPPVILATKANDWLHGNSLHYDPSDGSVIFSMRHQDWVIKINYGDGAGDGSIIWTLGKGGDFTMTSSDPYPWFSHQHDPGFITGSTSVFELFDNGNTRVAPPPTGLGSGNSRGYVLSLNQASKTATPIMLANLGFFSQAVGSAQRLANGDYHFEAGFGPGQPPFSQAIEVHPDTSLGFTVQLSGVVDYRTFRMVDLYTPPAN